MRVSGLKIYFFSVLILFLVVNGSDVGRNILMRSLVFWWSLSSFIYAAQGAETFEMGVEIQTAGFKFVTQSKYDVVMAKSKDGGWEFTSDSIDDHKQHLSDSEFRTVGGHNKTAIKKHIKEMGNVFKKLEKNILKTTNEDTTVTQQDVEQTLGMTWVNKKGKKQSYTMLRKTKKEGKSTDPITRVKPQITLHMPLKYMKKAFMRLRDLGYERIHKFIKIDKIKKLIKKRTDAAGLALLFEYYVYNLFTAKAPIQNRDIPGPKGIMSIMSRVSFSFMYDNLDSKSQNIFKTLVSQTISGCENDIIRGYINESGHNCNIRNALTIQEWYDSIVDVNKRKSGRDKLSPPPQLKTNYPMGTFDTTKSKPFHALIECRGYYGLFYKKEEISFDNFVEFLSNEVEEFFSWGG